MSRTISDIHRGGWSGQVDMFAAGDPIELRSRGEYEILLSSLGRDALFTERGAVVRFVRMEPVGPDLLYSVAQWAAYVCFIVAAVGVFFSIGTQAVVKDSFVEQK